VFLLTVDDSVTETMTAAGVWDWQATGSNGVVTLVEGRVDFVKDVARP
jgi:hypothetical protein